MTTWTLQDLPNTPEEDEAFKKLTEEQQQQEEADNESRSFWNHRVVRMPDDGTGTQWYEIQEVYYNRKGEPCGYCNSYVGGENMAELAEQIERHSKALALPILDSATDFNNKWEDDYEKEY
jgi:hypothetical protein